MSCQTIFTPNAPAPVGPYAQAILVDGKFLYTAGQIPLHPHTGSVVGSTIQEQTEQVFNNLEAILNAAGTSLAAVVKTTVFLKDMNDFVGMNEVYAKRFGHTTPARTTVEVSRLPKDVRVEIEILAVLE